MNFQRDFLKELIQRVSALEQQLASLRDSLKRDDGPDIGENMECFTRVQPADFMPVADTAGGFPFMRKSERFRRRCGEGSVTAHE